MFEQESYLNQLDLSYIIQKMCDQNYFLPYWNFSDAELCMQQYKQFLFLNKKFPDKGLVPTKNIDEFWHNHILHTEKYHRDCMAIFGFYLHHRPSRPNEDSTDLIEQYKQTKLLWEDTFGEPLVVLIRSIQPEKR